MRVYFLEIVTPDVNAQCKILSFATGTDFSGPVPELGNAMIADMADGGRVSVRAPMGDQEQPVTRPYMLTDNIHAAVKAAEDAGAMIMHAPLEIPGQGIFAIYMLGGVEQALWQV